MTNETRCNEAMTKASAELDAALVALRSLPTAKQRKAAGDKAFEEYYAACERALELVSE